MTVLEIEAKKAELVRSILNIESEDILNELSNFLKKLTVKAPSIPTDEEIRAGADRFLLALESGDETRFISQDDLEKKHKHIS